MSITMNWHHLDCCKEKYGSIDYTPVGDNNERTRDVFWGQLCNIQNECNPDESSFILGHEWIDRNEKKQ